MSRKLRTVKNENRLIADITKSNKLKVSGYANAAASAILTILTLKARLPDNIKKKFIYNKNEVSFAANFIINENYKYMGASITDYYKTINEQVTEPIALYILWLAYMKETHINTINDYNQSSYNKIGASINNFIKYLSELTGITTSFFKTPFNSAIRRELEKTDNSFWI